MAKEMILWANYIPARPSVINVLGSVLGTIESNSVYDY
jgi:hypothetical protein